MDNTVGSQQGVKRKLHDFSADTDSMGAVLTTPKETVADEPKSQDDRAGQDWETVDRLSRKRQKKLDKNYPALLHSNNARLSSQVKISDLQNLVLYLLADGTGPQWISVRHYQNFSKVVVLMVPGIDVDLFTGEVPLEDAKKASGPDTNDGSQIARNEDHKGENGHDNSTAKQHGVVEIQEKSGHEDGTSHGSDFSPQRRLVIVPENHFPTKLATQKMPEALHPFAAMFTHLWQVKTPGDHRRIHSPMYAMLSSSIPKPKEDKTKKGPKAPAEGRTWVNKPASITDFVATRSELLENGFALHPAHLTSDREREVERARRHKAVQSPEDGFVDILDIKSITDGQAASAAVQNDRIFAGRQLLVIDCEMVTTTVDRFALARVSLLDADGAVVLDELVKPPDPIKDYLTPYSGITPEMMQDVTTTLQDIQTRFSTLLTPQTILAGHSLDSDFRALKMSFPFVIDTTLLYPHPKGPPQKSSLKWLAQKYLDRNIQQNTTKGHDSVEDALACLDLIKQKCEKGKAWGTADAQGESIFKRLARTGRVEHRRPSDPPSLQHQISNGIADGDPEDKPHRTGAVVDWRGNMHGFAATAAVAISCTNDEEVVRGAIDAVNGTNRESHPNMPVGGCDFVFARMRELEFARGWTPSAIPPSTGSTDDVPAAQDDTDPTTPAAVPSPNLSAAATLSASVATTSARIQQIYDALPPRSAFIVFSGSGDPRDMVEWQKKYAAHKAEFLTTKWDEMVNRWTDVEEQAAKRAAEKAKRGVAFLGVK